MTDIIYQTCSGANFHHHCLNESILYCECAKINDALEDFAEIFPNAERIDYDWDKHRVVITLTEIILYITHWEVRL